MKLVDFFETGHTVNRILNWIKHYFIENGPDCKAIIGISGGKDSTVAAALLCKALGPDKVIAVKMPQGIQHDIEVANKVIEYLGITESYEINIGSACESIYRCIDEGYDFDNKISNNFVVSSNTPARVRMTILYAIAAERHGRVVNTCNKSEDYVGYSTKFGDSAGDFSILANYTVTEIKKIGEYLELPNEFIEKVPEDGLSGKTDEESLGFSYKELDEYLLSKITPDYETLKKIEQMHKRNIHKLEPMPTCPNYNY